jgi:hypothetical protein
VARKAEVPDPKDLIVLAEVCNGYFSEYGGPGELTACVRVLETLGVDVKDYAYLMPE